MNRKLRAAVAALLLAVLAAGCGARSQDVVKQDQAAAGSDQPVATLRIGQIPTIDGLPFWVAESQGYYRQQGVDVELVNFRSAAERDAALQGGQIDGALADPVAAVSMYTKGTRVHITSVNLGATEQEGPIAILAAPGSGITSPDQLKGVEVAISSNSVIHYVTEKLLTEAGLKQEEIKTLSIPQIPLRFESLMAGTVKAATLPEPLLSLAVAKGATVVLSDAEARGNYSQSVILFTGQAIDEKEEAVRRFFAAYNMAVRDIERDPDAFKELLATQANLPPEIKDSWRVFTFPLAQPPARADLEAVVDWLLSKGLIPRGVAYEEIVNATLYPETK